MLKLEFRLRNVLIIRQLEDFGIGSFWPVDVKLFFFTFIIFRYPKIRISFVNGFDTSSSQGFAIGQFRPVGV